LQADTLVNADTLGLSATQARPSYDGRWLMYTVSQRSNFPVFQRDADLWLMDLQTLAARPLDEVNSPDTESFHNWSQDSRWFVFTSKRSDGMYAQLFIASIDDKGKVSEPFLLPQRNPRKFYDEMMDSYNVADFTTEKVDFDAREAYRQVFNQERIKVKIK
jgi:dipeptidyl aminopeptidase/acylaminoacyl peptidase